MKSTKKLVKQFAPVLLVALLAGCTTTNSNIGPAAFRFAVGQTAGYMLINNTNALPGLRATRDIVCSLAAGNIVSPGEIVAALDATGNLNRESWAIATSVMGAYNLVFAARTNDLAMRPYSLALCSGLGDALAWQVNAPPPARAILPQGLNHTPQPKVWPLPRRP